MNNLIDLTGRRVNRLTVVRRVANKNRVPMWECLCDCGQTKVVSGNHLRQADVIDCGCGRSDRLRAVATTHGLSNTREWRIWRGMRGRCDNPNNPAYKHYGGRGIAVCDRWQTFENFYADMGPRPSEAHSIDRIDNNGPYSPENCRWATIHEQQNNRRSNVYLTLNGETKTMKQWATHYGISYAVVKMRREAGVEGADLFAPSPRRTYNTRYTVGNLSLTIAEWAKHLNAPYITVWQRVHLAGKNPDGTDIFKEN